MALSNTARLAYHTASAVQDSVVKGLATVTTGPSAAPTLEVATTMAATTTTPMANVLMEERLITLDPPSKPAAQAAATLAAHLAMSVSYRPPTIRFAASAAGVTVRMALATARTMGS